MKLLTAAILVAAATLAPGAAHAASVGGALDSALAAGAITPEARAEYARIYAEARQVRSRLRGVRRKELSYVVRTAEQLAAGGRLSASRMPAVFLTLDRNTLLWREKPVPSPGARMTLGDSPVIFQYYEDRGIQIQPVANFLQANAYLNTCEGIVPEPGPCPRGAVRRLLDAMTRIAAVREGHNAWEYYFEFAGGQPPWVSGMAQGAAIGAYARAARLFDDPALLEVGRGALGLFEIGGPAGVRKPLAGGAHYLIYSYDANLLVLNGFLQALIGLYDFAQVSGDPRAHALFQAGDATARATIPGFDTGGWSLYARGRRGGRESDLTYHRLVRFFLEQLCERVQAPIYCTTAANFNRYLEEDPRIEFLGGGGAIKFRLSKVSFVTITVRRGGRVVMRRRARFGYGKHAIRFRGGGQVQLFAQDLRNHEGRDAGSL